MEKRFRSPSSHRRPTRGKREPYSRVLIVCEGEKTEPNYFAGLRNRLKLSTSNITVTGECGSAPSSVFDKAKEIAKKDGEYDKVYCVFDKDRHPCYDSATQTARSKKFIPIRSVPCFETWILLHFRYSDKSYCASGNKSICDNVIVDVRSEDGFRDYQKGAKTHFNALLDKLPQAMANAKRLRDENAKTGNDNPSTDIDTLVNDLFSLKLAKCWHDRPETESCPSRQQPGDTVRTCLTCNVVKLN